MNVSEFLLSRANFMLALALLVAACDQPGSQLIPDARPSCESERTVEGWTVTAGREKAHSGDMDVKKWEARRNFSTHFGLRITYDTSEGPAPFLQIWHDYTSGEFVMRLEDDSHFRMKLSAQYAVSSGTLPAGVFEQISRQPVRIEHTSHTNKWTVYETRGLPEAITAAKVDLEAVGRRLIDGECRV